jgi:regulation of enolase protein 1 (concanavalin A-like superfamily)
VAGRDSHLASRAWGGIRVPPLTDGGRWSLVRYFTLGDGADDVAVGFSAQSPTGDGCTATFSDITFQPTLLEELRSGA